LPGEVAATVVPDPARRSHIEVEVAVLALSEPGRPRQVLSLGEANWDKIMTTRQVDRLRRARDLLSAKGHDTSTAKLTCYSGAGFDSGLLELARTDPQVQLVSNQDLPRSPPDRQAPGRAVD
jgi:uncharacterized protein